MKLLFRWVWVISLLIWGFLRVEAQTQNSKNLGNPNPDKVWSYEKALTWYKAQAWLNGSDYIPSTAINQLEMWQADTFDPETINREFKLAKGLGMNTMRVFLHSLAWKQDPVGFKTRINIFLKIADNQGIRPMFVFFDDCWNKTPKLGIQPQPKPGIHNSGWIQDPGQPASEDSSLYPELEKYVKDIMGTFQHDPRILLGIYIMSRVIQARGKGLYPY